MSSQNKNANKVTTYKTNPIQMLHIHTHTQTILSKRLVSQQLITRKLTYTVKLAIIQRFHEIK